MIQAGSVVGKRDQPSSGRAWLWVALVLAAVFALWFALRIPFDGSNPDETSHVDYIRLLVERRGFVRFVPGDSQLYETHQPPLYYLLCAPLYTAFGGTLLPLRLVNIILQLLTVAVAWRIGRDLFPSRPEAASGTALFVALLPTQAQLAGSVSNDGLTTLVCALLFWKSARMLWRGQKRGGALLMGAILGIGLYTKLSVLQVLPLIALCYALAVRTGKMTARTALVRFGTVLLVGFVLASPWLIRNTLLYGDPLTLKIYKLTGPNIPPQTIMAGLRWTFVDYLRTVTVRTFATFWFILPPNQLQPPLLPFAGTGLLALVGMVGAFRDEERGGLPRGPERWALGVSLTAVLLLVPFFASFVLQTFQAQGRYFLPALVPAALICVLGWSNVLGEKYRRVAVGVVAGVLLLLCIMQAASF